MSMVDEESILLEHNLNPLTPGESATCNTVELLDLGGPGHLAGEFPGGITTIDGVPGPAEIRVLLRPGKGHIGDGVIVATTSSAPDGTWCVDGLNMNFKYDVVGRKDGFNDVIVANVSPVIDEP